MDNRRWKLFITDDIEAIARTDAHLHALLHVWAGRNDLSLRWVAEEYLKRWPDLAELVGRMGLRVETWRELWPEWREPTTSLKPHEDEIAMQARQVIVMAAMVAAQIMRCVSDWLKMQPPPPIIVTKEQAEALGVKPATLPRAAARAKDQA